MGDTPGMREMSVSEQRYEAVRAVLAVAHQMPAEVEVALVETRRAHPWGPRRLVFELAKAGVEPVLHEDSDGVWV